MERTSSTTQKLREYQLSDQVVQSDKVSKTSQIPTEWTIRKLLYIIPKRPFAHHWNLLMNPNGTRPAGNVRYSIGFYFPNKSSSKEPMERPPLNTLKVAVFVFLLIGIANLRLHVFSPFLMICHDPSFHGYLSGLVLRSITKTDMVPFDTSHPL